jgi:hypothetical protein
LTLSSLSVSLLISYSSIENSSEVSFALSLLGAADLRQYSSSEDEESVDRQYSSREDVESVDRQYSSREDEESDDKQYSSREDEEAGIGEDSLMA